MEEIEVYFYNTEKNNNSIKCCFSSIVFSLIYNWSVRMQQFL